MTPEFEGNLLMNEVTWFKFAHCILSLLLRFKKVVISLD
jgi:hypothetical protein